MGPGERHLAADGAAVAGRAALLGDPGLRIVVLGIARSLAPIGGMAALTFFAPLRVRDHRMGCFGDHDPERFGNIGRALLTCFQVLTLEGWNEVLDKEMAYSFSGRGSTSSASC